MSSNYISRKIDTEQLSLKHFLGKCLHLKGEENLLDTQAKWLSPLKEGRRNEASHIWWQKVMEQCLHICNYYRLYYCKYPKIHLGIYKTYMGTKCTF